MSARVSGFSNADVCVCVCVCVCVVCVCVCGSCSLPGRGGLMRQPAESQPPPAGGNCCWSQSPIASLWTCLMNDVEWNKKEELVTEQALKHLKVLTHTHTHIHTHTHTHNLGSAACAES